MEIIALFITAWIMVAIIASQIQGRDGVWHMHKFPNMRRRAPDGSWDYRPMTEDEKLEDYDARQF
jgi:hypothetical protein